MNKILDIKTFDTKLESQIFFMETLNEIIKTGVLKKIK